MLFNGKQQDAHECLLILLDIIHMDTNGMIQSDPGQMAASKALAGSASVQATTPAEDEWSVVDKAEATDGSCSLGVEDENADVVDMDSVVSTYMRGILRCETVSAPPCCGGSNLMWCVRRSLFHISSTKEIFDFGFVFELVLFLIWSFFCEHRRVHSVTAWAQTLLGH